MPLTISTVKKDQELRLLCREFGWVIPFIKAFPHITQLTPEEITALFINSAVVVQKTPEEDTIVFIDKISLLHARGKTLEIAKENFNKQAKLIAEDLANFFKRLKAKKQSIKLMTAYLASKKNTQAIEKMLFQLSIGFIQDWKIGNKINTPAILMEAVLSIPWAVLLIAGAMVLGTAGGLATGIGLLVGAFVCFISVVAFHFYFKSENRVNRQIIEKKKFTQTLFRVNNKLSVLKKMLKIVDQFPCELPSPDLTQQKNHETDELKKAKLINHFLKQLTLNEKTWSCQFKFSIPNSEKEKNNLAKMIKIIETVTGDKIKLHWNKSSKAFQTQTLNGYFTLSFYKTSRLKHFLESTLDPKKMLGDTYHIKNIRTGVNDYFSSSFMFSITRSLKQKFKFLLRTGEKKTFVVKGKGVKKRDARINKVKSEPKKYEGEHPFSQSQPTSYTFKDYQSNLFQFNSDKPIISGVAIPAKDVYLSDYVSIYDGGTVDNSNHFNNKTNANNFYDDKVAVYPEHKRILYGAYEIEEFQASLKNTHHPKHEGKDYNEVLTGLRWNTDGSSHLIIGSDDFETRILTLYRAEQLLERLKKQAQENNEPWDPHYRVPICFYSTKRFGKHLKPYDIFQQQKDLKQLRKIAANKYKRKEKYDKDDLEFLFMLSESEANKIYLEDTDLVEKLLDKSQLSVLLAYLKKLNQKNLIDLFSSHKLFYLKFIQKIIKHKHSFSPDLIHHLIKLEIHQKDLHYQKFVFNLAALHGLTDMVEKEFLNSENIKNHTALMASILDTTTGFLKSGNRFLLERFIDTLNCDAFNLYIKKMKYLERPCLFDDDKQFYILLLNKKFLQSLPEKTLSDFWQHLIETDETYFIEKIIAERGSQDLLDKGLAQCLIQPQNNYRDGLFRLLIRNGANINSLPRTMLDGAIALCIENNMTEPLLKILDRADISKTYSDLLTQSIFDVDVDTYGNKIPYIKMVKYFLNEGNYKGFIKTFTLMTQTHDVNMPSKFIKLYNRSETFAFHKNNSKLTTFIESWRLLLCAVNSIKNGRKFFPIELIKQLSMRDLDLICDFININKNNNKPDMRYYKWAFDQLKPSFLQSVSLTSATDQAENKNTVKTALKILDEMLTYVDISDDERKLIKNRTIENLIKKTSFAAFFKPHEKSPSPFLFTPSMLRTYTYSR